MLFPLLTALFLSASLFALPHQNVRSSMPVSLSDYQRAATTESSFVQDADDSSVQRLPLLERLGVPVWHQRGWRGRGMKVAILDSGFHGYREHLGKALPRSVKIHSFRFDGNLEAKDSQHGILCAEVIHALAPEAELLLANWEPERPQQFLAAVRWARREGARIISCSIIMPTWSDCQGHGRVHEELSRLLGYTEHGRDALFFASAGNTAQRHWSGDFRDGGDGYHVWKTKDGDHFTDNIIRPWGSERVSVELCCPTRAAYEVMVFDTMSQAVVGRATTTDVGGASSGVVAFVPEVGHEYRVRVRAVQRTTAAFHLVVLGGGLCHASPMGSIPFPGDGSEVIAVGAVDTAGRRLAYSSCGSSGSETKPDFVATVPFPSSWRARPFAGTSAAAPQASALAALLWSRHPDWNAEQIRSTFKDAARPCPASSSTWETGHGLLSLPAPVSTR